VHFQLRPDPLAK